MKRHLCKKDVYACIFILVGEMLRFRLIGKIASDTKKQGRICDLWILFILTFSHLI